MMTPPSESKLKVKLLENWANIDVTRDEVAINLKPKLGSCLFVCLVSNEICQPWPDRQLGGGVSPQTSAPKWICILERLMKGARCIMMWSTQ